MSESRERLIAAASELFLAGSFHNVGIAEICDAGHVNKGTFYHFFPSKIGLLLLVIDRYTQAVAEKFREIAESSDTPANKLHRLYALPASKNKAWQELYGSNSGCFVGNVVLELGATEPAVREKAQWALEVWSRALQPIVVEFMKAEGLQYGDPARIASTLVGLIQGAQVMGKAANDTALFADYGNVAVEVVRAMGSGAADASAATAAPARRAASQA